ncbi:MAG TPA: RecQ family ATP-dependent DNA helicase [Solirubrobacteraceae bacterium]|nr:RecQ family ATP-dependent DNA helicase [Solirubrobacteraceae bacterium]
MEVGDALKQHFGFDEFRPGQAEAVEAARSERDVLVVMPTGSGKSLCYQLPALIGDRVAVVVSPLVSLMTDQVDALARIAPGQAALVNAQQDTAANREALRRAVAGELRLLYVAPERFSAQGFADELRTANVGLFVVDEAHCVSQWGHDFRPDYFRLADAARYVGARSIVASTATATPRVAADIVERLGLRDPLRVTTGFDRPNLSFAVAPCRGRAEKHSRIAATLAQPDALPAIVYAGTRAGCERLATTLQGELGEHVDPYHAGLGRAERAEAQRRFMEGETRVVVATNAFGMGVDKADVRTVCHESVPQSIEAYYQEAGRAGRDGAPARCLLFAEGRDKGLHVFFIERARSDDSAVEQVARRLAGGGAGTTYDVDFAELKRIAGDDDDGLRSIVGQLARAGVIAPTPAPADRAVGKVLGPFDGRARSLCRTAAKEAERARWQQYRAIWRFVEQSSCRRTVILRHFGDRAQPSPSGPCCDVCDPSLVPAAARGRSPLSATATPGDPGDLDAAICETVSSADPAVGRTRAVEILRGGRSKPIRRHSYDGLPRYGSFGHLSAEQVLRRVDELLAAGRLRSSGGRYPTLAPA